MINICQHNKINLTIIGKRYILYCDKAKKERTMLIDVSKNLIKLAKIFPVELYIVGGYVRNRVMSIKDTDVDLCSKLKLDEVEEILKGTKFQFKLKNKILGTALICIDNEYYEYTTFRRDTYPDGGAHSPEKVKFIDSIEEDAKRRDFTCNALYYDIKNDKIIDFYNGVEDIKTKTLRAIGNPDEVFAHDGVRILRLFRFECELNFKIDKTTLLSAYKYKDNLRDISGERLIHEITCIFHAHDKYPDIAKPNSYMKALKHFNRGEIWPILGIDCLKVRYNMVKKVKHKSQGFLIDVLDSVKPISISYYLNLILTNSFGLNKKITDYYLNVISGYYEALNNLQNKPYFFKYFDNFPVIYLLLVHKSKYIANKYEFFYKYIISHKLIVSVKDLKISGDDIQTYYPTVKPERYKPILDSLLSDIFDGKIRNDKKELLQAIEAKLKYL